MDDSLDAYLDSLDAAYADDSEERFREQFCTRIDCDNCGKTFLKSTMYKLDKKRVCFSCMSQINDAWGPEENPYNWGYEGEGH